MKKNWYNILLQVWIALTSLVAFVAGWIFFGHSGKPVSASSQVGGQSAPAELAPLPTLAPLPSLNNNDFNNGGSTFNQMPQQPSFQFSQPRFRTRGS